LNLVHRRLIIKDTGRLYDWRIILIELHNNTFLCIISEVTFLDTNRILQKIQNVI